MLRPLLLTALALGAAAATTPAGAQPSAYGAGDRYGPAPAQTPTPAAYGYAAEVPPAAPPPMRGHVLMWPGKVAPRAPAMAAAYAPVAAPAFAYGRQGPAPRRADRSGAAAYGSPAARPSWSAPSRFSPGPQQEWAPAPRAPVAYAPTAQSAPPATAAPAPVPAAYAWRPVFAPPTAAPAASPNAPARPAQGYAPSWAAYPAPNRMQAADRRYGYDPTQNHAVRFYSVARQFGLRPDPAPIPPQFFTATADLSADPPGPLPTSHATNATARTAMVNGSDTGGQ